MPWMGYQHSNSPSIRRQNYTDNIHAAIGIRSREESAGCAPRILNLGNRWKWVISFTLRPLYPSTHWIGPRASVDTPVPKREIPTPARSRTPFVYPVQVTSSTTHRSIKTISSLIHRATGFGSFEMTFCGVCIWTRLCLCVIVSLCQLCVLRWQPVSLATVHVLKGMSIFSRDGANKEVSARDVLYRGVMRNCKSPVTINNVHCFHKYRFPLC
jgi:hypothetical protein